MARTLALDIGGANIKGLGPDGAPILRHFELWLRPRELEGALVEVLSPHFPLDEILVTMTGELCDAFETKAEGVRHILESLRDAVRGEGGLQVRVWRNDRRFASMKEASEDPLPAASANWIALALFAGRFATEGAAILVDIGSTTTDIIPLEDGRPIPRGLTDTERLLEGELVYTGVSRTAVAAVARELPYRGKLCPVSAELFATTLDAYLLLERKAEAPHCRNTADGRPETKASARDRMARMVCADRETFTEEDAREAALFVEKEQVRQVERAIKKVMDQMGAAPRVAVISGSGEFLARRATEGLGASRVSLADKLGSGISAVAPAYALKALAQDKGREGIAALGSGRKTGENSV